VEAEERLHEPSFRAGIGRPQLHQPLVLHERLLDVPAREQESREVVACDRESRIDAQRLVVVGGGAIGATLALFQHTERVVRLCHVGVRAPRSLEERARAREVAALELDEPEVHERLDEARAVLERQAEPRIGSLEVAARERFDAGGIEGRGGWRQRDSGRAAGEGQEQKRPHARDIGPRVGLVSTLPGGV
jgi:hypothetical protein